MALRSKFPWTVVAVLLVVGGAVVGLWKISQTSEGSPASNDVTRACIQHSNIIMHDHMKLRIIVNGAEQSIPPDVGMISASCLRPLHMHDMSGTVHIESPVRREFRLKEFFEVWGKTFNRNEILGTLVDAGHRIRMTVDGVEVDTFEETILRNEEEIIIWYESVN